MPGWRRLTHPQTPARRLLCTRTFRTAPSGNVLVRRAVDRGPRSCEDVTATPSHGQTLGPAGRALHRPPVGRGPPLHPNPLGRGLTVQARDGPVPPHGGRGGGQLEDVGADVGVRVCVGRRDVDGVQARPLADLRLLGQQLGGVVVNVDEIDLEGPGAAGRGGPCGADTGPRGSPLVPRPRSPTHHPGAPPPPQTRSHSTLHDRPPRGRARA